MGSVKSSGGGQQCGALICFVGDLTDGQVRADREHEQGDTGDNEEQWVYCLIQVW